MSVINVDWSIKFMRNHCCKLFAHSVTIAVIVFLRTPFQIFQMVVPRVFVLMVYLWVFVWIRNESGCHKPMYIVFLVFPFFVEKAHILISDTIVR